MAQPLTPHVPGADDRVLVAGLGLSGLATVEALSAMGCRILAVDGAKQLSADRTDRIASLGSNVDVELGLAMDTAEIPTIDGHLPTLAIVSPGWSPQLPLMRALAAAEVPMWSDVELAWRMRPHSGAAPWIAVTGTNGKTTTVRLIEAMVTASGRSCIAAGNVGTSIVEAVLANPDVLVVELSSFQLHRTTSMLPEASACLNVSPDHLDWHGDMAAYTADKATVYRGTRSVCVYPVGDETVTSMVRDAEVSDGARAVGVTIGIPGRGELGVVGDAICDRAFIANRQVEAREITSTNMLSTGLLAGGETPPPHLMFDVLTAAALALAVGVEPTEIAAALAVFRVDRHRIEDVGAVDGVRYIDDSKATNAHAAQASLGSYPPGSVVWIAGGLAKGAEFDDLVIARRDRLCAVVLIGADRSPLRAALTRHAPEIPVIEVESGEAGGMNDPVAIMQAAVRSAQASAMARGSSIVLLAPACASMDQFESYGHRGDVFAAAVKELARSDGR